MLGLSSWSITSLSEATPPPARENVAGSPRGVRAAKVELIRPGDGADAQLVLGGRTRGGRRSRTRQGGGGEEKELCSRDREMKGRCKGRLEMKAECLLEAFRDFAEELCGRARVEEEARTTRKVDGTVGGRKGGCRMVCRCGLRLCWVDAFTCCLGSEGGRRGREVIESRSRRSKFPPFAANCSLAWIH